MNLFHLLGNITLLPCGFLPQNPCCSKKQLFFKSMCQLSVAWSIHPKLPIFLHALQFIILDGPQLLHSFEKLKLQAMVSLYLVGCLLVCAPPPIPHLQLASFVYQYHQLSIMFFVVNFFVIAPQLLHLKYLILLLLNFVIFFHVVPMLSQP